MKVKNIISLGVVIIIALFILTLTGCEKKDDEINNSGEAEANFTLGKYYIKVDNVIVKDEEEYDDSIEFLDDNSFTAYTGFGNGLTGTYTVSDDKIACIADTSYSVYGPDQKTNAYMTFKINSDNEITLIGASSYQINTVDIPSNTLTDETKDMPAPFVEGARFTLSE